MISKVDRTVKVFLIGLCVALTIYLPMLLLGKDAKFIIHD